jgi:proton-coupled amino acid transporter
MRLAILISIAVSQIGFVAGWSFFVSPYCRLRTDPLAYSIFIAENLQAFILAVTDCKTYIATRYLIFAELIVFLPLAMIRNLAKLSGTALIADAFILIGCELIVPQGS